MSKKKNASLMSLGDRERLRVAATVTQEADWPQSEPNQGLARMFVIMLLVHIVVIGGVIVYDFVGEPAESKPVTTAPKAKPITGSGALAVQSPAPPTVKEKAATPAPVAPAPVPAPSPAPVVAANKTSTSSSSSATAVTTVPVESLLPANAPTTTLDTAAVIAAVPAPPSTVKHAEPLYSAPLSMPAALPAPAAESSSRMVSVPLSSMTHEESKSVQPAKIETSPPAPAKIITQTSNVKSDPPAKPKAKTEAVEKPSEPVRRAVAMGPQPKPVPTPSAARRALDDDNNNNNSKRSTAATPTARKKTEDAPPAPKKPAAKATTSSAGRYTVAKGDTVYKIARKYKVSEDAVMKANGIKNAASLQIGKNLVIPAK